MPHNYRREATYGKDTRGIIRVHQFNKIEMFVYRRLEDAAAEHRRLLDMEQDMLATIEVPYRIIDTAAGDLGGPAARKFDCEGWVPTQGRYRELTSTSNCTTFQARRLGTRSRGTPATRSPPRSTAPSRRPGGSSPLENHQQSDGSVVAPDALRSRVGPRRPPAAMTTPHLVALDIDGTTVNHEGELSPAVREVVRDVADAGHHVTIATGRAIVGTLPVLDRLGITTGMPCAPTVRSPCGSTLHSTPGTRSSTP